MTPIDFTGELAPLIWTIEGFMLVAVAWLVGMFFTEQTGTHDFYWLERKTVFDDSEPTPSATGTEPASDHDGRLAA